MNEQYIFFNPLNHVWDREMIVHALRDIESSNPAAKNIIDRFLSVRALSLDSPQRDLSFAKIIAQSNTDNASRQILEQKFPFHHIVSDPIEAGHTSISYFTRSAGGKIYIYQPLSEEENILHSNSVSSNICDVDSRYICEFIGSNMHSFSLYSNNVLLQLAISDNLQKAAYLFQLSTDRSVDIDSKLSYIRRLITMTQFTIAFEYNYRAIDILEMRELLRYETGLPIISIRHRNNGIYCSLKSPTVLPFFLYGEYILNTVLFFRRTCVAIQRLQDTTELTPLYLDLYMMIARSIIGKKNALRYGEYRLIGSVLSFLNLTVFKDCPLTIDMIRTLSVRNKAELLAPTVDASNAVLHYCLSSNIVQIQENTRTNFYSSVPYTTARSSIHMIFNRSLRGSLV